MEARVSLHRAVHLYRGGAWRKLAALGLLLTAACKTVGEDFPTERIAELRLAETSGEEVRAWFGEPYKVVAHDAPAPASEIAYYQEAYGTLAGGKARVLAVELADGGVRAWLFDSSMQADSTDFDADEREELSVGTSTMDDARALLGPPSGRFALPSHLLGQHLFEPLPEAAVEVWAWRHTEIDRNLFVLRSLTRILGLAFDAGGVLVRVEYQDSRD